MCEAKYSWVAAILFWTYIIACVVVGQVVMTEISHFMHFWQLVGFLFAYVWFCATLFVILLYAYMEL